MVVPDSSAAAATSGRQSISLALAGPSQSETAHRPFGSDGRNTAPSSWGSTVTPPAHFVAGSAWSTAVPSMSIAAWVMRSGSRAR